VIAATAFVAAALLLFFVRAGARAEQTLKLENQRQIDRDDNPEMTDSFGSEITVPNAH